MKKQPTKDTRRVVTDLPTRNDDAVKGGGTSTPAPVKYLEVQLQQVFVTGVTLSK
jgi:hypothetical protein